MSARMLAPALLSALLLLPAHPPRAAAWEEPWSQVEARTAPIKADRRVEAKRIRSANLGYSVPFKVMLPKDYDAAPDRRYGVVLMLCGASGCRRGAGAETLYFSVWCKMPKILDNLSRGVLEKKDFAGMITKEELAAFNADLAAEPFEDLIAVDLWHPSASRNVAYDRFVTDELLPFLDANYRTVPDRAFRSIDGACGGGAAALFIAFRNPEFFAQAGGMQTDLGSYPHLLSHFEEHAEAVGRYGMAVNLNTNVNDVCNSYDFTTHRTDDGTKRKVPSGALAKFEAMLVNAGVDASVTVFRHCNHGYSAYRYANGHHTMRFHGKRFRAARLAREGGAAVSPAPGAAGSGRR